MTREQRKAIHDVLMRGIKISDDDSLRLLLSALTWQDVDALEPVIDEWLTSAMRAGRRFSDRKTCEQILQLE